ncbi:MAG: hypothetical protein JNM63_06560, partial [Spirochaetia bacterium]|nr:hypothetical protein [Spirochaetia bacterium]
MPLRAFIFLIAISPGLANAQDLVRDKICLSGSWQFQALSNDTKIGSPHEMRVPGSWGSSGENLFSLTAEEFAATEAVYKRNFFAPLEWKGKGRIKLTLDAVVDGHRILVNGKKLLDSETLGLLEEIDLTDALKFGAENSLEILTRAFQQSSTSGLGTGASSDRSDRPTAKLYRIDRGILGDVWLSHVPETRVLWSHVFSDVKNKTLTVKTLVTNEGSQSQNASLAVSTWDEGKKALEIGEKSIQLPAKGSILVEQRAVWPKVVLWGFGRYGAPKLYNLRAEILIGGKKMDSFDDRFGFRDFRIEGTNYLFNGLPYYIAGDLSSRRGVFTENPSYIQAFLTRERASGMTFHRLHTHLGSTFDHPAWYEVADEMGHLIEAQNCRVISGGKLHEADSELNQAVWAATVNKHFNHPSIVMWCVDNESFSVAFKDIPDIPVEKIKSFDRLMTFVRSLDPSRIVEIQHNWTLWPFVKRGIMKAENFPTFNIHPYGKLDTEVRESMRVAGYEPTVPTCIGEVYTFPKDLDFLSRPGVAYGEQDRKLRSYKQQLEDVSAVDGVQGLILCAMMADGFVGFTDPERWHLGPWDDYAVQRSVDGEPSLRREFKVKVAWPSLSGPGVKAETILGYHVYYAVGFGLNVNWFDPTRPLYRSNVIDSGIKTVLEKIAGVAAPANTERSSELVVAVSRGGASVEGAYVHLIPLESQAQPYSVAADASGTAWFRVWENGKYRAFANVDGKILQAEVTLKRPSSQTPPGYSHVIWLELGGGNELTAIKKNLQNPAAFTDSFDVLKNEVSANGGFTAWSAPNKLIKWNGTASPDAWDGKPAIKLASSDRQVTQPIQLVRGRNYTLGAEIRGGRGTTGNIKITDSRYSLITSLPGVLGETKWRHFETNFTASESGLAYLFCQIVGSGSGDAGFAQVRVIGESNPDPLPAAFYPGPYAVTSKGFIRHWLALGPFPNRLDENGYEGFRTDWLKEVGGESGASAAFGDPVSVEFPNGF